MPRVRKYDLINGKEWEVKWSIGVSSLLLFLLLCIGFYDNFEVYEKALCDLLICFIGSMIGLLGFSLSGIAIIVSLFSKGETKNIEQINGKDTIAEILSSYTFLAKNIVVQCVALIVIYMLCSSEVVMAPIVIFYLILFLEIYHVIFILLYTVSLIENCIELYKIKNIYSEIESTQKTIHDNVNEIKIDFILSTLISNYGCSTTEVIDKMIQFVEESDISNKEAIIQYIKNQYQM